jgi:hypothetical protein
MKQEMDGVALLWAVLAMTVFLLLLGVLLVFLKLTHVINWAWIWVTLPFWGMASAALTLIALVLFVAFLVLWLE